MSSGMENLATGEGPVKREREEIKAVNNQGNSLPRKKFYRARAHCNPLSDSQFPVCVPATGLPHRRRRLVVPAPSRAHRPPRAHLARERRANPRSPSRASPVDPSPSVARLTTPRNSPAPSPDDSPLNPSEYNWEAHYPEFFAKAKEADPNAEAPLVRFADVGCGFGGLLVRLSPLFPNDLAVGASPLPSPAVFHHTRFRRLGGFSGVSHAPSSPSTRALTLTSSLSAPSSDDTQAWRSGIR